MLADIDNTWVDHLEGAPRAMSFPVEKVKLWCTEANLLMKVLTVLRFEAEGDAAG